MTHEKRMTWDQVFDVIAGDIIDSLCEAYPDDSPTWDHFHLDRIKRDLADDFLEATRRAGRRLRTPERTAEEIAWIRIEEKDAARQALASS